MSLILLIKNVIFVIGWALRNCQNIFVSSVLQNKINIIKCKRFSPCSRKLTRATSGSAGYDLFAAEKIKLKPDPSAEDFNKI